MINSNYDNIVKMDNMIVRSPMKSIIYFSIPILISSIFLNMYNIVDSIVVGRYVSESALAAVAACFPIVFMITSVFSGLTMGITILIAQFLGSKEYEQILISIFTSYVILIIGIIPLSILGIIFSRQLLIATNVPLEVLEDSALYLKILFGGIFFACGTEINSGILKGLGDSKSNLYFIIFGSLLHIILAIILVREFHMGIVGVAIATIASQFLTLILGLVYIKKSFGTLNLRKQKFEKSIVLTLLNIGIPFAIQQIVFSVGRIAMQSLINSKGTNFIAGYNVAGNIELFAYMIIQCLSTAIVIFTAQNLGAKKYERIKLGCRDTIIVCCIFSIVSSLIILYNGELLISGFTKNKEALNAGMAYLWRILPFYCLLSIFDILNSVIRGAKETFKPMLINVVSLVIVRLSAAYFLESKFGPENIFFGFGIGWIVGVVLTIYLYRNGKWRRALNN